MKRLLMTCAAACIIVCLSLSCTFEKSGTTGSLSLSFPMLTSKTLLPDIDMTPASYTVTGSGPNGASFSVSSNQQTAVVSSLAFGVWNVTVEAKNSDAVIIGQGSAQAVVHAGETTPVTVVVTPLDGYGNLDLIVNWSAAATEYPAIEASLLPATRSAIPLGFSITGGNHGTCLKPDIPVGYYTIAIRLMDGNPANVTPILVMGAVEVARIVKDQTTSGTFNFARINKPGGTIEVNITPEMAEPIEVTLNGQQDQIEAGGSMTVLANVPQDTGNTICVWYLNGESVTTGESYTVSSLPVGVYRLDAAVFTTDGKRAGSAGCELSVVETVIPRVVVNAMVYGDNSNFEGQSWNRIVRDFENENPDVDIRYEMRYDDAYHERVAERISLNDIPDVAYMGGDARWGTPWMEAGQQFDHRPFIDSNYYDVSLIPPMGPNGEIWEIPLGTSNMCSVLYMNQALVESLGFSAPASYADIAAMAAAAQAAGKDVITIDGTDGWAWGSCLMSCIIARLSGDVHWVSKAVIGVNHFTDQVFVDSLALLRQMVQDGVISASNLYTDYGSNISKYSQGNALFMIQGQWAAGGFDPAVADNTLMLAWPTLPGENSVTAGSMAAAIQVGYGLTGTGGENPAVRDAALRFLKYFNNIADTTERLRSGAIVAPILKDYIIPTDLPIIIQRKIQLAQAAAATYTDVIDAYLSGAPNDALNSRMQKIVAGISTPEEVAADVESLIRP